MEEQVQGLSRWTDIVEEQIRTTGEPVLEQIEEALSHIDEKNDRGLFGLCNFYMAYYSLRKGTQEECLRYLSEGIRCVTGTAQERQAARCYNLLGIIAHGQNSLLLAMEQYDRALFYADKYNDHYMHNLIVSNKADVYYRTGLYDKAFSCYREAIREYECSGNRSTSGIHNYMMLLANYGYCLAMGGELEEAGKVSERLDAVRRDQRGEPYPELGVYTFFALLCHKTGKTELAENCLNVAVQAAMGRESLTEDYDNFLNLFDLLILMEKYGHMEALLDCIEPSAAAEGNEGLLLVLLSYRLKYCGDRMTDRQYMESAKVFFRIKERYESREYGNVLSMLEMRNRLYRIGEERQRLEEQNTKLRYQAEHDELSGLFNRGSLRRYAEEAFEQALRKRKLFGVIFVDIDYFKQMNDDYGHGSGDCCIRAVADCIRKSVPEDFAARYGGDEFVIIMPDRDRDHVRRCAQRIVDTVGERQIENRNSGVSDVLTVTVGAVCDVPGKHSRIWDFLTAADMTLYRQKKEKKGCMRFADRVGGDV